MKKDVTAGMVGCLVVIMLTGLVLACPLCEDIFVKITPNTLNPKSRGGWVTVHADIPYIAVDRKTVCLNGISAKFVEADDCGNLMAKFDLEAVKESVEDSVCKGCVELTLTGKTIDGVSFSGTDTIRVIEKKKKK